MDRNFIRIDSTSIYLSPLRVDEKAIETYTKWMANPEVNKWIGKNNSVCTYQNECEWANRNHDEIRFNIILKKKYSAFKEDTLIGNCSIKVSNRNGTLGICIGEQIGQNHGYGTETIKMLIKFGFEELNLHAINLQLIADNKRAYKCYLKAGFKECGRTRECYYYEGHYSDVIHMDILKSEYFN